jgi:glycosyltransferase involved in cell wall biosynthesis
MQGVSVIMPCYNAGEYLKEAVLSVLRQEASCPFELIIVNDASTDPETLAALKFIEEKWAPVMPVKIFHHDRNQGPSAANNLALKHALYDFVLPVDSDDKLVPPHETKDGKGYIQKTFDAFVQNPQLGVVTCDVQNFGHFESEHKFPRIFSPAQFLEKCTIWNHSAYRRKDALAAGGYDDGVRLASDFVFYGRLLNHHDGRGQAMQVHVIPETLFCYRRHSPGVRHVNAEGSHLTGWKTMTERFPDLYAKHFPHVPLKALPHYFWLKKMASSRNKRLLPLFVKAVLQEKPMDSALPPPQPRQN